MNALAKRIDYEIFTKSENHIHNTLDYDLRVVIDRANLTHPNPGADMQIMITIDSATKNRVYEFFHEN